MTAVFDLPAWFVLPYLFLVGSAMGSFLNVCIHRLPRTGLPDDYDPLWSQLKRLWSPPSHCPRCQNRLWRRDNLPIIGWLLLRGRCRFCRGRISIRYPLVELFNGLMFVAVFCAEIPLTPQGAIQDSGLYVEFGPQILGASPTFLFWRYLYHLVMLEGLVVASFIDWDQRIIPDGSTVPAMIVGVVVAFASGRMFLVPIWFQEPGLVATASLYLPDWFVALTDIGAAKYPQWIHDYPHLHGLTVSVVGMIVGGGVVWIVRWVGFLILRQEAMGFGDVVLMAMVGSFLGWQATLVVFFIAPACALTVVAASLVFRREREIPYGPYLSIAALILLLFWQKIWPIAQNFFSTGPLLLLVAIFGIVSLAASLSLMQLAKKLLGIPLYHEDSEWIERWTSADQLCYFAGENVDQQQGRWRRREWPGINSGRGQLHEARWRNGVKY